MKKLAFLAAAALIATTGIASAKVKDLAAGTYLFTVKTLTVSDAAGGAYCNALSQAVNGVTYAFATYTPATATTAGSLLVESSSGGPNEYIVAESIPAGKTLVGYVAPAASVSEATFPDGVPTAASFAAGITLQFTTSKTETETISYGPYACTITTSVTEKAI